MGWYSPAPTADGMGEEGYYYTGDELRGDMSRYVDGDGMGAFVRAY
jgi:hypothetical protein